MYYSVKLQKTIMCEFFKLSDKVKCSVLWETAKALVKSNCDDLEYEIVYVFAYVFDYNFNGMSEQDIKILENIKKLLDVKNEN